MPEEIDVTQLSAQFQFGALRIAALSDGVGGQHPNDWFPGVPAADWMPVVAATDATALLPVNFGSFLIRGGGRTVHSRRCAGPADSSGPSGDVADVYPE